MNTKLRFIIIITLASLIAFVILMVFMIKENGKCIDRPFEYSAKKLNESGGNYACSCVSLDPKLLDFTFNENGIEILTANDYVRNNPIVYDEFNWSGIEIVRVK